VNAIELIRRAREAGIVLRLTEDGGVKAILPYEGDFPILEELRARREEIAALLRQETPWAQENGLPRHLDPEAPGITEAERNRRLLKLIEEHALVNTLTRRFILARVGDRFAIEGRAPTPGEVRIYAAWVEEYDPLYVLARTDHGAFYAWPQTLKAYGHRGQDGRGPYFTLEEGRWMRADVPVPAGSRAREGGRHER